MHPFPPSGTLREQAKEKGQQLVEMGPGDPVTAEVHIGGDLVVIGSPQGLRTAAKIAYVGLAHVVGVKVAAGDAFTEVRRFILEGKPEGVARFFINKRYLEACQQGPHQHSIAIAARRDKHHVDAIVRLFGELTYFVVLSDHYDGADFCTTLVYDAYRGEENGMLFAHEQAEILQMEDVANSPETVWGDLERFGRNFCAFLERMMEQKRLKDIAAKKLAAKAEVQSIREDPIISVHSEGGAHQIFQATKLRTLRDLKRPLAVSRRSLKTKTVA